MNKFIPDRNNPNEKQGDRNRITPPAAPQAEPERNENLSYTGNVDIPMIKVPMVKCECCNGTGLRPANTDLYGKKIEATNDVS